MIPISDAQAEAARGWSRRLKAAGLRVHVDDRTETLNYRIREGEMQKVPYMAVIGQREAGGGQSRAPGARGGEEAGGYDGGRLPGPACSGKCARGPSCPEPGMTPSPASDEGLVRVIGVRALALACINMIVGASIFVLPASIAGQLGAAAIISYGVCAVILLLVGLCFAEAGSRVSASGGTYAYIERAFGPFVGFLASTFLWFASGSLASASVSNAFVGTLAAAVPALGQGVPRALVLALLRRAGARSARRGPLRRRRKVLVPFGCLGALHLQAGQWDGRCRRSAVGPAAFRVSGDRPPRRDPAREDSGPATSACAAEPTPPDRVVPCFGPARSGRRRSTLPVGAARVLAAAAVRAGPRRPTPRAARPGASQVPHAPCRDPGVRHARIRLCGHRQLPYACPDRERRGAHALPARLPRGDTPAAPGGARRRSAARYARWHRGCPAGVSGDHMGAVVPQPAEFAALAVTVGVASAIYAWARWRAAVRRRLPTPIGEV